MADVVVTVPLAFGLDRWVDEGDLPGEGWSGLESYFHLGGSPPAILQGERVYIVYNRKLRGYAPLRRVERDGSSFALVRRGGAVAVTVPGLVIPGFRGFRYRWWDQAQEVPFPDWRTP